ncbi:MAG: metal-dependent transcriptional regulator [Acidimicrobiales bacterium]
MRRTPAREQTVSGAGRRYLEAAYYLAGEGVPIRRARLAEWLGVAAPSVTEAVSRLHHDGLLELGPGRLLQLSEEGRRVAAEVVRRHRIIEAWAVLSLKLDWVAADEEAQLLAPVVSDRVLDRLHEVIGRPACCPHGNRIPGEDAPPEHSRRLSELVEGESARVVRISELAEHDAHDILDAAYRARLTPTTPVRVGAVAADGAMTLEVAGGEVQIWPRVASAVWVTRGPARPHSRTEASGTRL